VQQTPPARGALISVGVDPPIRVDFQYNPAQLTDKRVVTYATLNAPGQVIPFHQYSQGGDRTISFTVRVDGLGDGPVDPERDSTGGITPELNKYRAFLYPPTGRPISDADASFLPLYEPGRQFTEPPACRLQLGIRVIDCVVTELTITELLFNPHLCPIRADVALTLIEVA
jgi:hypothetical protein